MRVAVSTLLCLLAACAAETPRDYAAYRPFDEANLASQWARLAAHERIKSIGDGATLGTAPDAFADVLDAYEAELAEKVAGREDDRVVEQGFGHAGIGAFLDGEIRSAIALGAEAGDARDVAYAAELVDKSLLVFFAFSVYHELALRQRAKLDEAYGYYGLGFDGVSTRGSVAAVAAGREAEFGVSLNGPVHRAFVDAWYELEARTQGDDALVVDDAYVAAWATIDASVRRTFVYYAMHEVDEMVPENVDVKLLEARVVWDVVDAWAAHEAPAEADAVRAQLFPGGVPARGAGYYLHGLDAVHAGEVVVDDIALRGALADALGAME